MTPETLGHLEKARECLRYAHVNLDAGLTNDAGRNAYLAEFHAAQALIFERTGKVAKTHSGVHTEFNRLGLQEPGLGPELRRILPQTYNLKAVADYETGPDSLIPFERAAAAVKSAGQFVDCIANVLLRPRSESTS
ncbi:MAG TPA: HEPN domain-containing protein [Rhizomicrobium sp.]|nr:HEPN domain-containing protein [Rhizomicrobium sp.]